ncbi:hypothetical protein pdam_00024572, partial [Pocillopora damicornis]
MSKFSPLDLVKTFVRNFSAYQAIEGSWERKSFPWRKPFACIPSVTPKETNGTEGENEGVGRDMLEFLRRIIDGQGLHKEPSKFQANVNFPEPHTRDFNADLLNPDKPPKDGRYLSDLMEIFGLDCLITKATLKTKTSETLLDLISTSNKKKALVSDAVDKQISDHSLVFTILRSRAPRSRS